MFNPYSTNHLDSGLTMDEKLLHLKCQMPDFQLLEDTITNWMEYFDTKQEHTKGLAMINALELDLVNHDASRANRVAKTLADTLKYVFNRCQKLRYLNIMLPQDAFLRLTPTPCKTRDYFDNRNYDLEDPVESPTTENIKHIVFESVPLTKPFLSSAYMELSEIESLELFDCSFKLDKFNNCSIDLSGIKYAEHFLLCVQTLIQNPTMQHLIIKIEMVEMTVVCYKWKVTKKLTGKFVLTTEAALNTAKLIEPKSTTVVTIRCPRLDQLTIINTYKQETGKYTSEKVNPSADIGK